MTSLGWCSIQCHVRVSRPRCHVSWQRRNQWNSNCTVYLRHTCAVNTCTMLSNWVHYYAIFNIRPRDMCVIQCWFREQQKLTDDSPSSIYCAMLRFNRQSRAFRIHVQVMSWYSAVCCRTSSNNHHWWTGGWRDMYLKYSLVIKLHAVFHIKRKNCAGITVLITDPELRWNYDAKENLELFILLFRRSTTNIQYVHAK